MNNLIIDDWKTKTTKKISSKDFAGKMVKSPNSCGQTEVSHSEKN